VAAPIDEINVDTDQIVPARFLKYSREVGYGRFLFHDLRFDPGGAERPEFVLNRPAFRAARILVVNENFGCGSSREGAVYALADYGIRAVIGPSFGDIFHNNCLKNGLVPVRLPADTVATLRGTLVARPGSRLVVDLPGQRVIASDGAGYPFEIDAFWKEALLQGVDEIGLTLGLGEEITAFEKRYWAERPWLP
jgi:3-isopropylmalate/(R)-2-methylmalate dehydratase small subunit